MTATLKALPMLDVRLVATSATGERIELLLGWVPKGNVADALEILRAPTTLTPRARDDDRSRLERARARHQRELDESLGRPVWP